MLKVLRFLPLGLLLTLTAAFAAEPAAKPAAPADIRVGGYVTSLYDLNSTNNTFVADFWLWFVHKKDKDLKPLKTLEPENARDLKTSLDTTEDYGDVRYHAAKVRGVFNHGWDVTNFPFDRHELVIRLSEAQTEADGIVYSPDTANTTFDPGIVLDGWKIEKVSIATHTHDYNSAFGVPGSTPKSSYASAAISIFIRRDAAGLFIKLHAAVYIIFFVSLISFIMDSSKDGFFSARIGMISGMIFATVLNTQRIASTLGGNNAVTLPDKIHILTLLALLVALVVALVTRRLHAAGKSPAAFKLDRTVGLWTFAVYTIANVTLIALARSA